MKGGKDTPPIVLASVRKAMKGKELGEISGSWFVKRVRKQLKRKRVAENCMNAKRPVFGSCRKCRGWMGMRRLAKHTEEFLFSPRGVSIDII